MTLSETPLPPPSTPHELAITVEEKIISECVDTNKGRRRGGVVSALVINRAMNRARLCVIRLGV